jgi:FAD/FMN-containing dehydrogenase
MLRVQTLTGDVVDRFNPGYPDARLNFNRRLERFPRYVVFCASVHDVQNAVRWSRAHDLPLRPRSGRHSYEAFSVVDGGVVIDVSPLRAVTLDAARNLATVGAGATLGQVYDALWDQGRVTVPGGGCTGVGVAGLALGGGFGFLARPYGLTCDRLVGMEMVNADGEVVRADAEREPDLFWGARGGGGGNFGVTTAFTFRVQPVDNVTVFSISWPWRDIRAVFSAWQEWADPDTLDDRLTPILILPAESAGYLNVIGEFVGPFLELDARIQPLLHAGTPSDLKIVYEPYIDAVHRFVGAAPAAAPSFRLLADGAGDAALDKFKNTSAFAFDPWPPEAVDTMVAQLRASPTPNTTLQVNLHGGAEARVAPDATAYPWRRARYSLQYQAYWSDPAQGPELTRWVEGFRRAMLPWTRGAYVNYIDMDIADWPTAYYDGNLARLVRVKRAYDPANVFDFPQGLGRVGQP